MAHRFPSSRSRETLVTYLKLSGCKLGYLTSFDTPTIKQGIERIVLSSA